MLYAGIFAIVEGFETCILNEKFASFSLVDLDFGRSL